MAGMENWTPEERKKAEKYTEMAKLFFECDFPIVFYDFFDMKSDKLLDEKIEVLTALKEGKTIDEIPNFYDILELYPGDDVMWD